MSHETPHVPDGSSASPAPREAAASSSQQGEAALVEDLADLVVVVSDDGRYTYVSPASEHVLGCAPDAMRGRAVRALVHPQDEAMVEQALRQARASGEKQRVTYRHRTGSDADDYAADDYAWVESTVRCRRSDEQEVVMVLRGTSDRVKTELTLWRNERRFRLLAENMTDLVCLHEPDGTYVYVSPSVERILGYTPEELVGTNPYDFFHPDDRERICAKAHEETLGGAVPTLIAYRIRTKAGAYTWLETTSRLINRTDGGPRRLLTSSREVGERVQAQQALAESNAALKQRNRELQDFAYVASHDLQEPLRKIRTFAGLMLDDYAEAVDQTGRYYLDRMQDGAARLSDLIADLLAFSRVTTQARPFGEVDLAEVAEAVRSDLEIRIAETGGAVEIGALPTIAADGTQMRQLLQNLMSNALKFHRDGVPPVVRVTAEAVHEPMVDGGDARDGCRLLVSDEGIGFDPKYVDRIFTPFQRLHGRGAYEGSGMGLAICRRIAERHGGTIAVESAPGEGSTFVVRLPLRHPEHLPEEREAPREHYPARDEEGNEKDF